MSHLYSLSVSDAVKQITSGEITPLELVQSCLARIKEVDHQVQAWKSVDEDAALKIAKERTEEVKKGQIRGPLHGIPIGIKDIIDMNGQRTECGSLVGQTFPLAEEDAYIVSKLKQLGAIIIGKTHTAELALSEPGPPRNPYNLMHTTGGSSSGSAVAVAAQMTLLTVGTQTNASICRPAAYNGVGGFKPTEGKIPTHGVFPFSKTFDTLGFFGKRFADAAYGYYTIDPNADPSLFSGTVTRPLRIGLVNEDIYEEANEEVKHMMKVSIQAFTHAGHQIVTVKPPCSFDALVKNHGTVMAYEGAQEHAELVKENFHLIGDSFCQYITMGSQIAKEAYEEAKGEILEAKEMMQSFYQTCDILLIPTTDTPPQKGRTPSGNPGFSTPWTVLGVPLAVIPSGLSEYGLPLSITLAMAPGHDLELIQHAIALESLLAPLPAPILRS